MSCIKLKHSNLYRHFCKLGEQAWGQKMPQNTSARSVGHARIFCVTRITKNQDWIAGKPLAPRSLFLNRQLLLCLLYFICYWQKSSTMIFWGLSLFRAYQSCRALVRLWATPPLGQGKGCPRVGHYSFTIPSSGNTQIHYKERTCCSFATTVSQRRVCEIMQASLYYMHWLLWKTL